MVLSCVDAGLVVGKCIINVVLVYCLCGVRTVCVILFLCSVCEVLVWH